MTGTITEAATSRRVSTRLKIGVIFVPFVFAWLLLRHGYSTLARWLAFGWMAIGILLFALARPNPKIPEQQRPVAIPGAVETRPTANQLDYVHELPLKTAKGGRATATALSVNGKQLRALWLELEGFRHDPKFHALGFDNPFQYGEWRGRVRALDHSAGKAMIAEIGFPPGELLTLGGEYLKSKGMRTKRSDEIEQRLDAALNPKSVAVGAGRVTQDTEGCMNFDLVAKSLRELENGDFPASDAAHNEANCDTIPAGSVVSAPAVRRAYDWLKDKGQRVYVRVQVNHNQVWVPEEEISY
ncbi:hypothetical protein ABIC78_004273 [Novosphingobium sp. 1529]|uniref:hypothetical protein n=1 Tax=Novosphingobium sp. 1529 TaxID=3156424 RepID=UPI003397DFD2